MGPAEQIEGELDGDGKRFAVVASRFHRAIVDRLIEGAVGCLQKHGVQSGDVQIVRVPGAWEISQAAEEIAVLGKVDGLITVGVIIRGETPHFDHLCAECMRGLGSLASRYRLPISFGILTCDTAEQANERAGGEVGNKGLEAAEAALEMACLFGELRA